MSSTAAQTGAVPRRTVFIRDFAASIVVFLVAMPLCMGIAIASGVPPEKGLLTGIIGGLVVGMMAGSPLQVSGPAAGLAVIVFEFVRQFGLGALGPLLLLAGAFQFFAGAARLGGWFRAISPAVVHGMLAGIGVLILIGQFHVLFDDRPRPSGVENLLEIPMALWRLFTESHLTAAAFAAGIICIVTMLAWEKYRPRNLRLVPGALVGVTLATLVAFFFQLDLVRVDVPESIFASISTPTLADVTGLISPQFIATALAIAFIAGAETLISAAAVDRMHDGPRTDYNKELRAQGVGNFLCGAVGALPMTGVIVRSSANVQAGAMTRASAIMHGAWILAAVMALPWLLREIPMAALAGVLVVTGWRLVSLDHVRHLYHHYGAMPALIWAGTLFMVVTTDLLMGVLTGLVLSLVELLPHVRSLKLKVDINEQDHQVELALKGRATFLTLPRLIKALDSVPAGAAVRLDVAQLVQLDHTCAEVLIEWVQRRRRAGLPMELTGTSDSSSGNSHRRLAEVVSA
jgi:MFS superfamily sulfate permease-like transporter